jgi:predicted RNA-binding protein associated with RNAse of E/G family
MIELKDDQILVIENNLIITKWNTLHPRKDIDRGVSAFYLDKGLKVSKIYDKNNHVVYWYCDIIQYKRDTTNNTIIIEDLLIDVILYEDGAMRIMDLDELSDALERRLLTQAEAIYALRTLDSLLKLIYEGNFQVLKIPVNEAEAN